MAENSLEAFTGASVSSFRRMSLNQRVLLGAVFLAVVGAVFFISRLGGSTSMGVLYSGLDPDSAAGIVAELESQGVPYELSDSGRVIRVQRTDVAAVRLDMSAAGLPDSNDGWSILDDQGITSSEFDQRVGYQRAMESELASTIAVIDGVALANVHLVIPEQDLFVDDEIHPSASVLLQKDPGAQLTATQIQAIVNLVASSIEGLSAIDVTVTDDEGRLLAGGDEDGVAGMEADNQTRMRQSYEADIEDQLTRLLTAVVGPGRSVVTVAADLDFDTVLTTQEQFNEATDAANQTLPQAETTRLERYGDVAAPDLGVVDIEAEILEGPDATTDGSATYQLDERDVVYALNSVVTSTERAPGAIRSLSVAVVIDEELVPPDRLVEIEGMIAAAIGSDPDRGDVVAVNLLPFDISLEEQEAAAVEVAAAQEEAASSGGDGPMALIRLGAATVIGLFVLIGGLFMVRKASRREVIDSIDLESLSAATGDDPNATDENGEPLRTPQLGEATEEDLLELVANQPEDIAVVLRQWLSQPEENNQ
ncbi:MAG: flagellar M-ring protein FliF [Acidimicrobiales bacterium]|jgi:flagellar M-ring protein FliF